MERGNNTSVPGLACRPVTLGFLALLLISGALELAHCATRRGSGGARPSLPGLRSFTQSRVWLVLRIEDKSARPYIPDLWPIKQDDAKATLPQPGYPVLRMTCYVDSARLTAATRNEADNCFDKAERHCTQQRLGRITDVTFESREKDIPWVRYILNKSALSQERRIWTYFFNFCQEPGPLDPLQAKPECLGEVENKFHPALHELYQASSIEMKDALAVVDDFQRTRIIRPFCDGAVENVMAGIKITWKSANVSCTTQLGKLSDVNSMITNAGGVVSVTTERSQTDTASRPQSPHLTGDCWLTPKVEESCRIFIQHLEASRSVPCKGAMNLGLISPPELTTFLQPEPDSTLSWFLTYILVGKGLRWGTKIIHQLPAGRNHAVVTCHYGSDEANFRECSSNVRFYHDNAKTIFVVSDDTSILGNFLYNDDKRKPSETARMKYILDGHWSGGTQRSGMSAFKAPAKASIWHSLRPLKAKTFNVVVTNGDGKTREFTCSSNLESSFFLIKWRLSTSKNGEVKEYPRNSGEPVILRITWAFRSIVYQGRSMPASDVEEFVLTSDDDVQTTPKSSPKLSARISSKVSRHGRELRHAGARHGHAFPDIPEGIKGSYLNFDGCFDGLSSTTLFNAKKIEIRAGKTFDVRSTAIFDGRRKMSSPV